MIEITAQTTELLRASLTVLAVSFSIMALLNGLARVIEQRLWE